MPLEKQPDASTCLTKVAQYVRMSTEHQKYSTDNQSARIREYAAAHQMEIIKTFSDEGKSGLRIEGRNALKKLISDVKEGNTPFSAVLVYDISRWGRFQDSDESAYYEYICRNSGIDIHYCAEQFQNDGSPVSTIIKSVKRAMAGEYSRELSTKVFAGQCRLIQLGYRQGGPSGYGLRRMLVDENGKQKETLEPGQQKSIQTDRVILVPGPNHEIEIIKRIYKLFIDQQKNEKQIAAELNQLGILSDLNRPWSRGSIRQILTNEKYIGNNVFNRTSFKLKGKRIANTPETWIRAEGVFEAVVDKAAFLTAGKIIEARKAVYTDEEMVKGLKQLYQKYGYLSGTIINHSSSVPNTSSYTNRFGGLLQAYKLAGFKPYNDYNYLKVNRDLKKYRPKVIAETVSQLTEWGRSIEIDDNDELITINSEFTLGVALAPYSTNINDRPRWQIRFSRKTRPDITVAVRMDDENNAPLDYYLCPKSTFLQPAIKLAAQNGCAIDTFRISNLDHFFKLVERLPIREISQ